MEQRLPLREISDGMWEGEPIIVLGGGPSLRHVGDVSRLDQLEYRVIAVNCAIQLPVRSDLWVWLDLSFYQRTVTGEFGTLMKLVSQSYSGLQLTRTSNHYPTPDSCMCADCEARRALPNTVGRLDWRMCHELGPSISEGLCVGRSTGFWALNLAYCLGGDPIFLFGYDCRGIDGKEAWWHDVYSREPQDELAAYRPMRREFEAAGKRLLEEGRTLYNVSPGSAIRAFMTLRNIDEMFMVA